MEEFLEVCTYTLEGDVQVFAPAGESWYGGSLPQEVVAPASNLSLTQI